jgi:hypothetical protein
VPLSTNIGCLTPLLEEFKDVFELLPSELPLERKNVRIIPLEDGNKPPFKPMYRLNENELEKGKEISARYLEKQWIKLSSLPYGSPIFFVQKKDCTLWMVVDYRTLNKKIVKNCYPLLHIDNLFDQLAYA